MSSEKEKLVSPSELENVKVFGTVVEQIKDKKVIVFKYKAKKGYKRKNGHRQLLTKVKIDEFSIDGKSVKAITTVKPAVKKLDEEAKLKAEEPIKEEATEAQVKITEAPVKEKKVETATKAPAKKTETVKKAETAKKAPVKKAAEKPAPKKEAKPAAKKEAKPAVKKETKAAKEKKEKE